MQGGEQLLAIWSISNWKTPKDWDLYVATINMYKLKCSEFGLNHKKVIKIEQKCEKIAIFHCFSVT